MAKKRERVLNEDIKCGDCINSYDYYNNSLATGLPIMGKCKKTTYHVLLASVEKQCPYAVSRLGLKNKK